MVRASHNSRLQARATTRGPAGCCGVPRQAYGAAAKVDLHLVAGRALQPTERQRVALRDPSHEALHRTVAALEAVLADQILVDPLRAQTRLHSAADHLGKLLT